MKKLLLLLLLTSLCAAAAAQPEVKITREIQYGPGPEQVVYVYQPSQCRSRACPVTMWVHGGGWRRGDTSGKRATEMLTLWAEQGIVMVGVNYRLAPRHQHPAMVEDVASAIGWVKDNINQHGGNPDKVSLLGHSAGAHLVALVATNPSYLAAHGLTPKGAIANVFPIDTASFDLSRAPRPVAKMVKEAFGTDEEVLRKASPMWNVVNGGSYPPFIIAAARVRPDAVESAEQLERKLKAAGTRVELITMDFPGAGQLRAHGMIATELANMDSTMTKALVGRVLAER